MVPQTALTGMPLWLELVNSILIKWQVSMGKKKIIKRSAIKSFVNIDNYNHLTPTRYSDDVSFWTNLLSKKMSQLWNTRRGERPRSRLRKETRQGKQIVFLIALLLDKEQGNLYRAKTHLSAPVQYLQCVFTMVDLSFPPGNGIAPNHSQVINTWLNHDNSLGGGKV